MLFLSITHDNIIYCVGHAIFIGKARTYLGVIAKRRKSPFFYLSNHGKSPLFNT